VKKAKRPTPKSWPKLLNSLVPLVGIELTTYRLQDGKSFCLSVLLRDAKLYQLIGF
jgi:hypothetical protein